jgi:hypothetical protein
MCHDLYMNDRLCSELGALVGNTIVGRRLQVESSVCRHCEALPNGASPRRHQREISLLMMIVQMRCTAKLRPPILFIAGAGVCLVATEPAFL